jgi:hypothetical protein
MSIAIGKYWSSPALLAMRPFYIQYKHRCSKQTADRAGQQQSNKQKTTPVCSCSQVQETQIQQKHQSMCWPLCCWSLADAGLN